MSASFYIDHPAAGSGPRLEGRLKEPAGGAPIGTAVLAPPHPLYGGSIDNPVVTEIAAALDAAGFATLAFNWRGVGRSEGAPSGELSDAVADYRSAAAWLTDEMTAPEIAAGYSFGAVAAVSAVAEGLTARHLALVALPPSFLGGVDLASLDASIQVITGALDEIAPADDLARLLDPIERAELTVLPGADHFFAGPGLGRLRELMVVPSR